jgi:phosphosulfolactate synthase
MTPQLLQHAAGPDKGDVTTWHQDISRQRAFDDCITLPARTAKPREQGLTFVLDQGMNLFQLRDFLADAAPYIDLAKLGWGTSRLFQTTRLRAKIRTLRDHAIRVCPGGTLLELAVVHNCVEAFLHEAASLGFNCVEVSDGTIVMSHTTKLHLIRTAKALGLGVVSEVGKKVPFEDKFLKLETRIFQATAELEAGAWKVIIEGRESGSVGVYNATGEVQTDDVDALVQAIGLPNLVFETPQKAQQIWFCKQFGNQVNVGNIAPTDVIPLETLRTGLRADTLKAMH